MNIQGHDVVTKIVKSIDNEDWEEAAKLFLTVTPGYRDVIATVVLGRIDHHLDLWMEIANKTHHLEHLVPGEDDEIHPAPELGYDLSLLCDHLSTKYRQLNTAGNHISLDLMYGE